MGDDTQASKKRIADRQITKDHPGLDDEEDAPEQEFGSFQKASDEVLARRRIVKVRRNQSSVTPPEPAANPFAGIRLVPFAPAPTPSSTLAASEAETGENKTAGDDESSNNKADVEAESKVTESEDKLDGVVDKEQVAPTEQVTPTEGEVQVNHTDQSDKGNADKADELPPSDEKEADGGADKTAEAENADDKEAEGEKNENSDEKENEKTEGSGSAGASFSSFQQLSSGQNAFSGFSGSGFSTGFSSSSFSFGSIQKDGSPSQSAPTFNFGTSNNGSTAIFGAAGTSIGSKSEATTFPSMQEVPRETGEENEQTVFSAESALFEFFDGQWKERGKGEVKLNVQKDETQKARLVMRTKGNLRLILNASVFSDMKLTKMEKKGITFACVNIATEGKDGLSTFALKFKDASVVEEFSSAVAAHKGKPISTLKTPENSP